MVKIDQQELLIGGADPNTIWLREERLKGSFLAENGTLMVGSFFLTVMSDGNKIMIQ